MWDSNGQTITLAIKEHCNARWRWNRPCGNGPNDRSRGGLLCGVSRARLHEFRGRSGTLGQRSLWWTSGCLSARPLRPSCDPAWPSSRLPACLGSRIWPTFRWRFRSRIWPRERQRSEVVKPSLGNGRVLCKAPEALTRRLNASAKATLFDQRNQHYPLQERNMTMPGGDRTDPAGMGPMTGRAAGYCPPSGSPLLLLPRLAGPLARPP